MFYNNTMPTRFMGSLDDYHGADVVLVGAPMDFTCSFRPGTRFGPQKIREVSTGIEEYSVYMHQSLEYSRYFDAGDLELPFGNVEKSLDIIGKACEQIYADNKFPLFIGGEHLVSLPLIEQAYKKYGDDMVLLHFDAHADLREDYMGEGHSHASVIRKVCSFMKGTNIYQFGIRSGAKEEMQFAKNNTNMYLFEVVKPFMEQIEKIENRPIYVTMDIDVVDPAFANGTGTPEPGGCSSREILKVASHMKRLNLIGFDLVEVSPHYDNSDRTALLAAKIIREIILSIKI